MKKAIIIILLTCSAKGLEAQKIEKFYDYEWKPCEPGSARFYSQMEKKDSGWVRRDYYLPSGTIQMIGLYKDSSSKVMNGMFRFYYPNKILSSTGRYIDNKKDGLWLGWHDNGFIKDSTEYDAGEQVGSALHWYKNGFMQDSIVHRPDGSSVSVSWFDDGTLSAAGRNNMFNAYNGKWQFFHRNGQLSAEEVYDNGRLLSRKYFSENGVPQADTTDRSAPATFPGGLDKWLRYLENHLYWPRNYQLLNGDKAWIGTEFIIDENGNLKDINITVPFETAFNDIVINTLKSSPKWIPAVSHNRKIAFLHRQSLGFQQRARQ